MKIDTIKKMTNGWMIGDFEPNVLRTKEFEIAHHHYKKDFKAVPHTHRMATEYNYIVSGHLIATGHELRAGNLFIYEPNDVADVVFLEDTDLIIVKVPSVPSDKYEV